MGVAISCIRPGPCTETAPISNSEFSFPGPAACSTLGRMDIQVAALCDSAVDYDGKLCLLGAFDTIVTVAAPAIHPQCSVALRILFRKEEEGPHHVTVLFVDEDGRSIVPPMETAFVVALPEDVYFATRNLILNMQQLPFPRPGAYSIDISVDKRQTASIPLQVRLVRPPEPAM
jgi:hypothetical protein